MNGHNMSLPAHTSQRLPSPGYSRLLVVALSALAGCVPYDRYEPGPMSSGPKWYHYALDHGLVFAVVGGAVVIGISAALKRGNNKKGK